jgi:hypothetical protein
MCGSWGSRLFSLWVSPSSISAILMDPVKTEWSVREVMDGIRVRCGRGRPRTRPGEVSGDSAYDTRGGRAYLRRRGIKAIIPVNIRNRRRPRHGRFYRLDLETYKRMRSSVERFFARLTNGFRRLAIR